MQRTLDRAVIRARLMRVALLVLLGVGSVTLFGWDCSTRRELPPPSASVGPPQAPETGN